MPTDDEDWGKGLRELFGDGGHMCEAPVLERHAPDLIVTSDPSVIPGEAPWRFLDVTRAIEHLAPEVEHRLEVIALRERWDREARRR